MGVQGLAFPAPPVPASADCLFTDVYAPSELGENIPVLVWLQGGAFVNLFSPNYNGSALVEASFNNAVVVSFNSRVGRQGFLGAKSCRA